jgi:DnaJ-class molecular chaperone
MDLYECPLCKGAGVCYDREHEGGDRCPMCHGSGTVDFDPSDQTIPF